jgi:hypothetical protein
MKRIILICLLLSGCNTLQKTSVDVVGTGLSHHLIERTNPPYNETNSGVGLRLNFNNDTAIQSGFYNNSYNNQSNYAILDYSPYKLLRQNDCGKIDVGGFIGAATGYKTYPVPVGGIQGAIHCGDFYVRSRVTPAPIAGAVLSVEFGYTIFKF